MLLILTDKFYVSLNSVYMIHSSQQMNVKIRKRKLF